MIEDDDLGVIFKLSPLPPMSLRHVKLYSSKSLKHSSLQKNSGGPNLIYNDKI